MSHEPNQAMGPLKGFKFIEMAGVGPTQLCGMLLADMGAEIIRIDRITPVDLGMNLPAKYELMNRSRRSIAIDLKNPEGIKTVLRLCAHADGLFEGFRPGVMERLGLGPKDCLARNPRLVYGRMTGWGQDGPLAQAAGHDPNYIGIAGVLNTIGERNGPPVYPLNLIGDFGGGALYLAMGLLAAVLETSRSGKGQVIDCAMVDGVASMMTLFYGLMAAGQWTEQRGHNVLDGGTHFTRPYRTKDDRYIVIAPIEGRFYETLLKKLGIDDDDLHDQMNRDRWPEFQEKLQAVFLTRTRDEWCEIMEGSDTCFAPVLSLSEAHNHPHAVARDTYVKVDGITQPAPAPRFERTPAAIQRPPAESGEHSIDVLHSWGFSQEEVRQLTDSKVIRQNTPSSK